jgi:hypothetical protein
LFRIERTGIVPDALATLMAARLLDKMDQDKAAGREVLELRGSIHSDPTRRRCHLGCVPITALTVACDADAVSEEPGTTADDLTAGDA